MSRKSNRQGMTIGGVLIALLLLIGAMFFPNLNNAGTDTPEPPTAIVNQPAPQAPTEAAPPGSADTVTPVPTEPQLPAWLTVYFTNPNPPDDVNNGIDRFIVPLLDGATTSINIVSFDFNLPSVVNALIRARARNVEVRLVVDMPTKEGESGGEQFLAVDRYTGWDTAYLTHDNKDWDILKILSDAGIGAVNGGRSNGLMHNKMIIIDGRTLVMGSWNMSYNDTYRNNNNVLVITAPDLIANYQAKFNELYVDQRFGTHAEIGAQNPVLTIDGVSVANYFSPVDHVMDKLVALVGVAQHSVRFIIFTYTDKNLSAAMIARYQAGVDVQGIIENRGASQGALVPLFCAKVPVRTDGNKYTMHHKVIVIDEHIVITGSFNFTNTADTANDDNVLIIDDPVLAKLYLDEFDRLNSIAKDPDPANIVCP